MNCEYEPILGGNQDDPVIKTIPPPPLHTVLLGPVNHVIKQLNRRFSKILKNISNLHIQRAKYHGKQFEGNQCRSILKHIENLGIPDCFSEFKDVLIAIRDLHQLCNEQLLPSNYHKVIDQFRKAWYKLTDEYDISTPPKIHILLDHLEDYFDLTDITLIKTTDELCEHMHQYLNKMLLRSFYYVKDISNPSHGPRLFRAVRHLNSYNIYIKK